MALCLGFRGIEFFRILNDFLSGLSELVVVVHKVVIVHKNRE